MSEIEDILLMQMRIIGLPEPERELKFDSVRRWRFDIAYPSSMIAIEVEGGTWRKSRHTTGEGFEKDCEKYNAAVLSGWKVLRFTSGMVKDGRALEVIEKILKEIEL